MKHCSLYSEFLLLQAHCATMKKYNLYAIVPTKQNMLEVGRTIVLISIFNFMSLLFLNDINISNTLYSTPMYFILFSYSLLVHN